MFGFWEILLILALFVLVFGAKKIPDIARGLGRGIRNFKGEVDAGREADDEERRLGEGHDHTRE